MMAWYFLSSVPVRDTSTATVPSSRVPVVDRVPGSAI